MKYLLAGGPGLLDIHGFKKASYNTFFLSSRLGTQVLSQNRYHLLSKIPDGYSLLLFIWFTMSWNIRQFEMTVPPTITVMTGHFGRKISCCI